MSPSPRLLMIMGSGETAPTMVKAHRAAFDRVATDAPAALIDTPYGFQENADEVSARARDYFRRSVGREVGVASLRSRDDVGTVEYETALTVIRRAGWLFAGPGSPSYALRQWRETPVPDLLASKLRDGGCLVFASAAALTLGVVTVPVYEVYKVGEEPRWLEGLDLLSETGLRAAVIPHFDNTEGGTHDTRYCYLGERRLARLERELPEGAFVLGVDEHTACLFDLDLRTMTVVGRGAVTVRAAGREARFPEGELVDVERLTAAAHGGPSGGAAATGQAAFEAPPVAERSPLLVEVDSQENRFDAALDAGDVTGAVGAVLDLEQTIADWSGDTLQSDEPDRARRVLRSMVSRLGELAVEGGRDPRERLSPFVDALLDVRDRARAERRFDDADEVRDRLLAAGIEVRDEAVGSTWDLRR